MPSVSMRQLLEAGVHFGHQTRRWNPKMRPFIFAERNGIHIIDLAQTVQRLDVALEAVRETVARGDQVLFVGTKKQAQEPIVAEATRANMPYVQKRWLGGMLTNFTTIKKRIGLLEQLEARQQAGDFERMTKKEAAKLTEEMIKLQGTVGGMRKMKRLPGAVFIVDPHRERIAVTEANKLEIPIVGTGDTNVDPDELDYIIPANDDAIRADPAALRARRRGGHRRRPAALGAGRQRARRDRAMRDARDRGGGPGRLRRARRGAGRWRRAHLRARCRRGRPPARRPRRSSRGGRRRGRRRRPPPRRSPPSSPARRPRRPRATTSRPLEAPARPRGHDAGDPRPAADTEPPPAGARARPHDTTNRSTRPTWRTSPRSWSRNFESGPAPASWTARTR